VAHDIFLKIDSTCVVPLAAANARARVTVLVHSIAVGSGRRGNGHQGRHASVGQIGAAREHNVDLGERAFHSSQSHFGCDPIWNSVVRCQALCFIISRDGNSNPSLRAVLELLVCHSTFVQCILWNSQRHCLSKLQNESPRHSVVDPLG
jgi:hypothetical protein